MLNMLFADAGVHQPFFAQQCRTETNRVNLRVNHSYGCLVLHWPCATIDFAEAWPDRAQPNEAFTAGVAAVLRGSPGCFVQNTESLGGDGAWLQL